MGAYDVYGGSRPVGSLKEKNIGWVIQPNVHYVEEADYAISACANFAAAGRHWRGLGAADRMRSCRTVWTRGGASGRT